MNRNEPVETVTLSIITKKRLYILKKLNELEDSCNYTYDTIISNLIDFVYETIKEEEPPYDLSKLTPEEQKLWTEKYSEVYKEKKRPKSYGFGI